jgi:hypothetical protein
MYIPIEDLDRTMLARLGDKRRAADSDGKAPHPLFT